MSCSNNYASTLPYAKLSQTVQVPLLSQRTAPRPRNKLWQDVYQNVRRKMRCQLDVQSAALAFRDLVIICERKCLIRNTTPPRASNTHITVVIDIVTPFTAALAINIVPQVPASVTVEGCGCCHIVLVGCGCQVPATTGLQVWPQGQQPIVLSKARAHAQEGHCALVAAVSHRLRLSVPGLAVVGMLSRDGLSVYSERLNMIHQLSGEKRKRKVRMVGEKESPCRTCMQHARIKDESRVWRSMRIDRYKPWFTRVPRLDLDLVPTD
ncbi:hypothetical protein KCU81_g299, partial [Aureobasidium melanogenum]